jgi:hypothetical protein
MLAGEALLFDTVIDTTLLIYVLAAGLLNNEVKVVFANDTDVVIRLMAVVFCRFKVTIFMP